jgi:hypothetical protein
MERRLQVLMSFQCLAALPHALQNNRSAAALVVVRSTGTPVEETALDELLRR